MGFKKVPAEHVELFEAAVPKEPDVERRKMFGCPTAFVNGNLFCGAFEDTFNIRLDDETRAQAFAMGFRPFSAMGKTMREYALVPDAKVDDIAFLREWFYKALAHTRGLPAKEPKTARLRRSRSR